MQKTLLRALVPVAAVLLLLLFLEVAIRGYGAARALFAGEVAPPGPPVPLHVLTREPFLYGLNPEHPGISPQGTRDDAVAVPKPPGTFRVLVLGDSLAYGASLAPEKTFPNRLESLLRERAGPPAEVVNAAVSGYGPYNELHYYLTRGREFGADVVVVAFCMNDVVNPRLHWGDAPGVEIPDEAVPNLDYDRRHVLPKIRQMNEGAGRAAGDGGPPLLKHSRLYAALEPALKRLFARPRDFGEGRRVPTYITGEDTISIEVLLDESSPEWLWLTSLYTRLRDAVRADGATLVVALFPLAYQLDEGYPFLPQRRLAAFCERNSIISLDLLPAFRRRAKGDIFLLDNSGYHDVWHLTEEGHRASAEALLRLMQEKGLLPAGGNAE
ncbi:MAG: GDSL-type esterase/lipase family protein [Acidobacteriota bacterium]|nr:GDSL-type esterase/lipase family protein [Acidobacteriota bacterium]